MVVPKEEEERLVYDLRISSVVPGSISGENKIHELKGIDLAMKMHYIKGLYFFTNNTNNNVSEDTNGGTTSFISIHELKNKAMFDWLSSYFMACGRIRMSATESGERPTIKMNDAGVRIVEAKSSKTVDEWLAMEGFLSLQDHLVYNPTLGPDLPFSPLVCIQFTWFKCGGISVGLSWAHILGDAFSASESMNVFGQYMQGHYQQPKTLSLQKTPIPNYQPSMQAQEPITVKRVDPVGDHWILPRNTKIGSHTFHLTSKQLGHLHLKVYGSKMNDHNGTSQCFEVISGIMWRSIAKIRNDLETNIVTICRPKTSQRQQVVPYNGQVISSIIYPDISVSSVDPSKLVRLIVENRVDENESVEELVNKEMGKFDFFVYGTNLTFVDMEEADIYGFKLKGKCPTFASYTIGGIGDKGAVLVLPGPNGGKYIVTFLSENEVGPLKSELKKEWCIE